MRVFYYTCEFIWVAVEAWMTFEILAGIAEPKQKKKTEQILRILSVLFVAGLDIGNRLITTTLFSNAFLILGSIIISTMGCWLYRIRFTASFIVCYMFWIVIAYVDFFVQILTYIGLVEVMLMPNILLRVGVERGTYLLVYSAGVFSLGKLMRKEFPIIMRELKSPKLVGAICVVGTFFLMAYFQRIYLLDISAEYMGIWELIIIVILISATFIIGYFYRQRREQREQLLQVKMDALAENYHQVMELYQEKATLVHDEKNHILAIRGMVAEGKTGQALKYMDDISERLRGRSNRQITGNEFLDLILNMKLQQADQAGIQMELKFDQMVELRMEEFDICALFANLLDNAIEANCELPEENEKWIRLVGKRHGHMLNVKLENPVYGEKSADHFLVTRKDKRYHGFGMKSIQKVVDTYDGYMEYDIKSGVFSQQFYLNCLESINEKNKEEMS